MNPAERQRNHAQVMFQLATLYRDPKHVPSTEQREAARALGLEHMLPDPEQERIKV